jgi:hypothetical protein
MLLEIRTQRLDEGLCRLIMAAPTAIHPYPRRTHGSGRFQLLSATFRPTVDIRKRAALS